MHNSIIYLIFVVQFKTIKYIKVEIKNIKINLAFSEETTCFKADIYIDDKKTGYTQNEGHGGCTYYHPYNGQDCFDAIRAAEKHFSAMPDFLISIPSMEGKDFKIKSTLECFIDDEIDKKVQAKEDAKYNKKKEKDFLKYICIEIPNGYRMINWKNYTLTQMLGTPVGMAMIQKKVDELKAKGEVILNTNLVGINI